MKVNISKRLKVRQWLEGRVVEMQTGLLGGQLSVEKGSAVTRYAAPRVHRKC